MNENDTIQSLSKRLIEAQRPVRILESVRWTNEVRAQFLRDGGAMMPKVDQAWYQARALGFDPEAVQSEFTNLRDVRLLSGYQPFKLKRFSAQRTIQEYSHRM